MSESLVRRRKDGHPDKAHEKDDDYICERRTEKGTELTKKRKRKIIKTNRIYE